MKGKSVHLADNFNTLRIWHFIYPKGIKNVEERIGEGEGIEYKEISLN